MSLFEKSNENLKASDLLIKNYCFNASIHSSYYACFQVIIKINERLNIKVNTTDATSHKNHINELKKYLVSKNYVEKEKLFKELFILKKRRIDADYKERLISETEAKESYDKSLKIKQQLIEIYEKYANQ